VLAGDLDETALAGLYDSADLFVLATLRETYGMAVAEALARGLPVVSTASGAIPSLVGDVAGIVVPTGDREALTEALTAMIRDPARRETAYGLRLTAYG
jgi:glycosyltransferase involved in cell wall biosynthesis